MRKIFLGVLLLILSIQISASIYDQYYHDALKIAKAMDINQKIGQTLQLDFGAVTTKEGGTSPDLGIKYYLGSFLIGGNGVPDANGNLADMPN